MLLSGRKRTLADRTVYQYGSIDTSLDPPMSLFSLDSSFKLASVNPVLISITFSMFLIL
jgi:hypothetical protein